MTEDVLRDAALVPRNTQKRWASKHLV